MKCLQCQAPLRQRREDFDYTLSGLSVKLLDVEVSRCTRCPEWEVAIPRIEELHRVLAGLVIRKPGRLACSEIRFLRSWLGWTGAELAMTLGVTATQVSRWENGMAMGATAERLLRLVVAEREPAASRLSIEDLRRLMVRDSARPRPLRLELKARGGNWSSRPAA